MEQRECETDPRVLARRALADTPLYVDHISQLFEQTVELLRNGEDQSAMNCFAQSASDLTSFLELFQHLIAIARPSTNSEIRQFEDLIVSAVASLQVSLEEQDYVTLSDQLEGTLLPVFPYWPRVAEELSHALAQEP